MTTPNPTPTPPQKQSSSPTPQTQPLTITPSNIHPFPDPIRAKHEASILWATHTLCPTTPLNSAPPCLSTPPQTAFHFAVHYHLYDTWAMTIVAGIEQQQQDSKRATQGVNWSAAQMEDVVKVLRRVVWMRGRVKRGEGVGWLDCDGDGDDTAAAAALSSNRCAPPAKSMAGQVAGGEGRPRRGRPAKAVENRGWGANARIISLGCGEKTAETAGGDVAVAGCGDERDAGGEEDDMSFGLEGGTEVRRAASPARSRQACSESMMMWESTGASDEAGRRQA